MKTSVLYGGEWSASRPGRFNPAERAPGADWTGGWVGSRVDLNAVVKRTISCPCWESNPGRPARTRCYNDWAIPAPYVKCNAHIQIETVYDWLFVHATGKRWQPSASTYHSITCMAWMREKARESNSTIAYVQQMVTLPIEFSKDVTLVMMYLFTGLRCT
jgi:hypothetical protein